MYDGFRQVCSSHLNQFFVQLNSALFRTHDDHPEQRQVILSFVLYYRLLVFLLAEPGAEVVDPRWHARRQHAAEDEQEHELQREDRHLVAAYLVLNIIIYFRRQRSDVDIKFCIKLVIRNGLLATWRLDSTYNHTHNNRLCQV